MSTKDPRVDAYIAKAADFAKPILNHLRNLVHQACPEVEEAFKWSFPCFMYKGILCNMAAFKEHSAFGFWKGSLMFANDPAVKKRTSEAMGHFGRITRLADLPADKIILGYIKEAVRLHDAGIKPPPKPKSNSRKELVVPHCLSSALKKNKQAQATFEQFSYSHKKEYVEWFTEAKRDETRDKRLETAITWLAQGKPRNWKYMNC
jgi:uncharacterized protein YdeI (YjbR/CyaY-like superfamily)